MNRSDGARVLVVDDEPRIRRTLRKTLSAQAFQVRTAENGGEALSEHGAWHPDIVLLDLGLPDIDGMDVLRQLRSVAATPIIVLSVRDAERDKVTALEQGADDYLTKPFGVEELLARINLALRHSAHLPPGSEATFKTGDLEIDLQRRRVLVDGREVHLTPTEYDLLMAFVRSPDRVLTDRMLLREVWGPSHEDEEHYLHVYMARLRKKLDFGPDKPRCIQTEPGVGYRLLSDEALMEKGRV